MKIGKLYLDESGIFPANASGAIARKLSVFDKSSASSLSKLILKALAIFEVCFLVISAPVISDINSVCNILYN